MVCLVCLRNEGNHFTNESHNDLEILLGLFELPQEFFQTLEGNECCSVCRVKLGFVEVIKQEIGILSEKLKCFKEEVKGIFVSSFDENEEALGSKENFQLAIQTRRKLLKELDLTVEMEEFEQTIFQDDSSQVSEIEINSPWQPDDLNENYENILLDPLQVEPSFNIVKIEENEEFTNSINSLVSQTLIDKPMGSISQESNQTSTEIYSSSVERQFPGKSKLAMAWKSKPRTVKLEKTPNYSKPKSRTSTSNSKGYQYSLNYHQRLQLAGKMSNTKGNKHRKSFCSICKPRVDFSGFAAYEEHLKIVHPSRPYSKCPKCYRIVMEKGQGMNHHLKKHMKEVHSSLRPYKCDHCEASFKTTGELKTHSEIHLEREIFICEHCNSTLIGKRNFKKHLKKHK